MPLHASDKTTLYAPDGNAIKVPARRTDILVRLWTRAGDGKNLLSSEANAKRQGAIAFIEDVIASKKGTLVSTGDGLFVSVMESPADALVASRQILLGMRAFQDRSADNPLAVSISIDTNLQNRDSEETLAPSARENFESNPAPAPLVSHDLSSLIRISRPAQVLLTHDLLQQVSAFKGLPLKVFQDRFGVFEYLWTSEEKLREFQSQQGGFVDLIEIDKPEKTPQLEPLQAPSIASDTYFEPRAKTPFGSEEIQGVGWKKALRNPWAITAVATLVLAMVVAAGIVSRGKKPAPVKTTSITQASVPTPQIQSRKLPELPPSTTGPNHQLPKQQKPAVAEQSKIAHQKEPKKKSEAAPGLVPTASTPALPRTECNLSGDLQRYIRVAEDYRSHGKYTDAERVFTQILACDPNNQDARKGLDRTMAAEAATRQ